MGWGSGEKNKSIASLSCDEAQWNHKMLNPHAGPGSVFAPWSAAPALEKTES